MTRPLLLLALLVHVWLAGSYAVTVPVFEPPDEHGHASYVHFLLERRGLPMIRGTAVANGRPASDERSMAHHPPLYYATLASLQTLMGARDLFPLNAIRDGNLRESTTRRKLSRRHGWDEVPPVSREIIVLRVERWLSVALGLVSLWLLAGIGRTIFPARPNVPDFAALGLACLPVWWQTHGVLDNGNLALTLVLGAVFVLVRDARLSVRTGVVFGLLSGLALLTKLTALVLLPVGAFVLGRELIRGERRRALASAAVALALIALLFGPFLARNSALYGQLLAGDAHAAAYASSLIPSADLGAYWSRVVPLSLMHSATGSFGRGSGSILVFQLAWIALGALGIVGFVWRGRRSIGDRDGAVLLGVVAFASTLFFVRYNLTFRQPQARYLLLAFAPSALAWSAGILALGQRWPRGTLGGTALCSMAASAWFLHAQLVPRLARELSTEDAGFASLTLDLTTPAPPSHQTIEALSPAPGAELVGAPTFRWRPGTEREGARWSLVLTTADGRLLGDSFAMAGVALETPEFAFPAELWDALPRGALRWSLREIPNRRLGEQTRDMQRSEPRTLVRR